VGLAVPACAGLFDFYLAYPKRAGYFKYYLWGIILIFFCHKRIFVGAFALKSALQRAF